MHKTRLFSILLLSSAFILTSCGGEAGSVPSTPSETSSSKSEPQSESSSAEESKSSESSRPSESSSSRPSSEPPQSSDEGSSKIDDGSKGSDSREDTDPGSKDLPSSEPEQSSSIPEESSSEPEIQETVVVTVNGTPIDIASLPTEGDDIALYEMELEMDVPVQMLIGKEALHFYVLQDGKEEDHGPTFKPIYSGKHTFRVAKDHKVHVTLPAPTYNVQCKVNGNLIELTNIHPDWDDIGVYELALAQGDKVSFILDKTQLHFYTWDGDTPIDGGILYTAPWAGTYTFGINQNKQVWYVTPEEPASVIEAKLNGVKYELTNLVEEGSTDLGYYKITLAVGDIIGFYYGIQPLPIFVNDGDSVKMLGSTFTAKRAGEHSFWVNKDKQVFYQEPEGTGLVTATVNGTEIELKNIHPDWPDYGVFFVALEKGDKIIFYLDGDPVHFYVNEVDIGTEYTAIRDGEYTFGVNEYGNGWMREADVNVTGTLNGEAMTLVDIKGSSSTDYVQYRLELAKGDKVKFQFDGVDIHFYDGETDLGTEYTAPKAGEYNFGISYEGHVWIGLPAVSYTAIINSGEPKVLQNVVPEGTTDRCQCKVDLRKDDVLTFYEDETLITFYTWDQLGEHELGSSYTAPRNGQYIVGINVDGKGFIVEPAADYKITVEGRERTEVPAAMPGCNGVFTIGLSPNRKVSILKDGQALYFQGTENTVYTTELNGEYKFIITLADEVVVEAPLSYTEYPINLGEWANDGAKIFAHSWLNGRSADTLVTDGKVKLITDCDGFVLVRMSPEYSEIDWDHCWNQTADMKLGMGSLNFKSWGEGKISVFEWTIPYVIKTATLHYGRDEAAAMDGTNQAALLGLDGETFSAIGTKVSGEENVKLNADGTISLLPNGATTLSLTGLKARIQAIDFSFKQGTYNNIQVKVGENVIAPADDLLYYVDAAVGTPIVISNLLEDAEVKLNSITISYVLVDAAI